MLACALVASAPASAAAQRTAAVMPAVGGNGDVVEAAREEARGVALEALRAENLVVLEPTRVEVTLDELQRACLPAAECAAAVRGALGVDLLVGLTISGSQVRASVVDAVGHSLGVADLAGDLGAAVREAIREALRAALERVAEDPARTVQPEVELSPRADPGGAALDWAVPLGGALLGAGVLVAVLPGAIGAATTGCAEMGAAGCVRFDDLDVGAVVGWAIAGSVLAVAGVVLIVVGATSSGAGSSGAGSSGVEVRARVGLGGLALEGSF